MVVITANPAATSTTLTSSRTSAIYGQSVTFTAVVAGLGMPTGTVTFYAGVVSRADQIGTGTLSVVNGHDQAAISVSTLKVNGSPYAITAVYSGDSSDQGSTSNSLSETITADPSTTSAHASATADPFGQTITVTATVAASAPGSGTPTGTVDFLDTTTGDDLATIALTGGTAALSVASLTPGSHSIKVSYSGDGNFTASSTTTSTITVNRSIIVLDPTAAAALDISGNASISLTGGVYVDSNSTNALAASGNAQISASLIAVVGGVQKSGNATFHPADHKGRSSARPALGPTSAGRNGTDQLWLVQPEWKFQGDNQPGNLQPDRGLGQRQPHAQFGSVHHRGGRLSGLVQRQRQRGRSDHLQYGQ